MRTVFLIACALVVGFATPRVVSSFLRPHVGGDDPPLFAEQGVAHRLYRAGAIVRCGPDHGERSSYIELTRKWCGGVEEWRSIESLPNLIEVDVACELSPDEIDRLGRIKTIRHIDISLATLSQPAVLRLKSLMPSASFFGGDPVISSGETKASSLK